MRKLSKVVLVVTSAAVALAGSGYVYVAWETRDAPVAAHLRSPGDGSMEPADTASSAEGRWVLHLSDTDYVGYRIRERIAAISAPNDVVGRTADAHGSLVIRSGELRSGVVTVNMQTLSTGVAPRDATMRGSGLQTDQFPQARFRLLRAVPLGDVRPGEVVRHVLHGALTLHGVTRNIDVPVAARWNGTTLQVAGSARVDRADFGIGVRDLIGFRIQSIGVLEFELTYTRGRVRATAAAPVALDKGTTGDPFAAAPVRPPCSGPWPAGTGRILTTVQHRGRGQIVVADLDHHRLTHISTRAAVDDVSWGPGRGEVTALLRTSDEAPGRLEVLDLNGHRSAPRLSLPAGAEQARWDPRGRLLAYAEATATGSQVRLSRGSGAGRPATPEGVYADAPSWSPDGRRLAVSLGEGPTNDDIGLVGSSADSPMRRVTHSRAYEYAPSWSPRGDEVAYVSDGAVRIMSTDGTASRPITRAAHDATPTWSPTGRRIAFLRAGSVFLTSSSGHQRPTCLPVGAHVSSAPDWN